MQAALCKLPSAQNSQSYGAIMSDAIAPEWADYEVVDGYPVCDLCDAPVEDGRFEWVWGENPIAVCDDCMEILEDHFDKHGWDGPVNKSL